MTIAIVLLLGACAGVLFGSSSVPQVRTLPTLCALIVALLAAGMLVMGDASNLPVAMLLVVVVVGTSVLYSAWLWLWRREFEGVKFSELAILELTHPGSLRRSYRELDRDAHKEELVG